MGNEQSYWAGGGRPMVDMRVGHNESDMSKSRVKQRPHLAFAHHYSKAGST